jgi:trans-aconitate methyltransferase
VRRRNPGPFDVILANAALQWIPDHEALLPTLIARLAPGGSLAVQVSDNLDEPAHCIMREIADGGSWAAKLTDECAGRAPWRRLVLQPSARLRLKCGYLANDLLPRFGRRRGGHN